MLQALALVGACLCVILGAVLTLRCGIHGCHESSLKPRLSAKRADFAARTCTAREDEDNVWLRPA